MTDKKTEETTISTRVAAEAIGTTPKALRVFLRASEDYAACGAGNRYTFKPADLGPMKTRFTAWTKEREAKAAEARKVASAPAATEPVADAPTAEAPAEPAPKPARRRATKAA